MAQRKRAGLITLRTPDRNGSPVLLQFVRFTEANRHSSRDVKQEQTLHRGGTAAARKAHNLEDTGSRPVPGIITLRQLYRSCHPFHRRGAEV